MNVGMIGIMTRFPGKPTLRWRLAHKGFDSEGSWG